FTRETALDCGACGWSTCVEHAVAIFRTESSWNLCLPLQRALFAEQEEQLVSHQSALEEAQMLDPLTGLWNRRAFAERLEIELARHDRYGSPLSIALIDIDHLGAANDEFGRDGGDMLLTVIADRIAGSLRVTDFAARWLGDQFALILPGIGKTAAFAVGEKLREAIRRAPLSVSADGYTREMAATVSIGIAAASPEVSNAHELLESADAALHDAMDAGGDRVHLAPG
ncbi:diguanylate cyclase, partial [bacterium]|nr:diguanylate cyclase [bacterium]